MTNRHNRAEWIIFAAVLLAGLGIRLGWGLRQAGDAQTFTQLPDQREYLALGRHLLEHDGLWFADPRFDQVVYAYRTPGYPLLVCLCQANPRIVRVVQATLDVSSIMAIFLLARRWLPMGKAVLAAGLMAVNPYLIFFTALVLSETLFTAMLCWGLALLVLSDGPWPAGRKRWAWLGGGLLLALSVLVRPGAIALPVVLGCAAALVNRDLHRAYPWRLPLPVAATFLLLTGLVLFPWAARNRLNPNLGVWVWTATNDGITRYDGFNPDATGASDQNFVKHMPWTRSMSEIQRSAYFADLADRWMAENPRAAMELAAVKIARTWSPIPLSAAYGGKRIYQIAGLSFGVLMDILVLAGLALGSLPKGVKWLLLLPAIYFTVSAAVSVGSLRYLIPAEEPMAIVAASAISKTRMTKPEWRIKSE